MGSQSRALGRHGEYLSHNNRPKPVENQDRRYRHANRGTRSRFDPEENTPLREPNINELGIIIGRKLIELMAGNITLQNRDAVGLEAIIQLPARPLKG